MDTLHIPGAIADFKHRLLSCGVDTEGISLNLCHQHQVEIAKTTFNLTYPTMHGRDVFDKYFGFTVNTTLKERCFICRQDGVIEHDSI